MRLMVTGGAGFIGSNYIRMLLNGELKGISKILVLDKLTYSGNKLNLVSLDSSLYEFIQGDICDTDLVSKLSKQVDAIVNFAAESHVDRSIDSSRDFIQTNVSGTHTLLESARKSNVSTFLQVSTDEVYGESMLEENEEKDTKKALGKNPIGFVVQDTSKALSTE